MAGEFNRRRILSLTLGAAAAAGAVRPALANVRWDMSYAWPSSNFHVKNGERFIQRVAQATNGAVQVTIHDNGSLGIKGPEAMAAVRDGAVPIAEYSFEQQNGLTPFASLGAMPGLAMGYDQTKILAEIMRPAMERIFTQFNQKLLYLVPWPGQGVYTRNLIGTLADLKGLKLRAANARAVEFFQALGASPILMPWAEVVPGLASGVIQGVSTSSSSGVDGKFWEFTKHYNRFDWANPLSVVVVNLDSWNKVSPQHRQAIEAIASEMEPQFWGVSKEEDDRNLAGLRQNGITVSEPSPALRGEIVSAAEKIWQAYGKEAGPEAAKVIADYRAKVG